MRESERKGKQQPHKPNRIFVSVMPFCIDRHNEIKVCNMFYPSEESGTANKLFRYLFERRPRWRLLFNFIFLDFFVSFLIFWERRILKRMRNNHKKWKKRTCNQNNGDGHHNKKWWFSSGGGIRRLESRIAFSSTKQAMQKGIFSNSTSIVHTIYNTLRS